jgi:hypothetical protein
VLALKIDHICKLRSAQLYNLSAASAENLKNKNVPKFRERVSEAAAAAAGAERASGDASQP